MNDRDNAAWQHGRQVHMDPQAQTQEAGNVSRTFGSMEIQTFAPPILSLAASSMAPFSDQTQRLAASAGVVPHQAQTSTSLTGILEPLTLHMPHNVHPQLANQGAYVLYLSQVPEHI